MAIGIGSSTPRQKSFEKLSRNSSLFYIFIFFTAMHIVYILHSQKLNRFYIGYSSNFEQRFEFHLNDTQTRKFTHKASDWQLYLKIECTSKYQALAIEKHIKSMKSKVYIQNVLKYPEIITKLLEKNKASDSDSEPK
jgi:putative endonuclease